MIVQKTMQQSQHFPAFHAERTAHFFAALHCKRCCTQHYSLLQVLSQLRLRAGEDDEGYLERVRGTVAPCIAQLANAATGVGVRKEINDVVVGLYNSPRAAVRCSPRCPFLPLFCFRFSSLFGAVHSASNHPRAAVHGTDARVFFLLHFFRRSHATQCDAACA